MRVTVAVRLLPLCIFSLAIGSANLAFAGDDENDNGNDMEFCQEFDGAAFGLCNAFCNAQQCHIDPKPSCEVLRRNFQRKTGLSTFPCEGAVTPSFTPTNTPLIFTPTATATGTAAAETATATATGVPATATETATAIPDTATATATATGTAAAETPTATATEEPATPTATEVPATATATATGTAAAETPTATATSEEPTATATEDLSTATATATATGTVAAETPTATEPPATETATGTPTGTAEATATVTPPTGGGEVTCAFDCNDDGVVSIAELLKVVIFSLGGPQPAGCEGLPSPMTIQQLVRGVREALEGCP